MGCQCARYERALEVKIESNPATEIIRSQLEDYPVLIYSRVYCEDSNQAKTLLRKFSIKFEYFELDHMHEETLILSGLQSMTGRKSPPYIFFSGKFYGGVSELAKGIESGDIFEKAKM